MSDQHKTLLGAARKPGDGPGGEPGEVSTDAAPEPVPPTAPPLEPLPERSCHICGAPESAQPLQGLGGSAPFVRCKDTGGCAGRLGERLHKPAAGGGAGPAPSPAAAPSQDSGAGTQTPRVPAPVKQAARGETRDSG